MDPTKALASLRILDLTQYEAGTSATQILAWLGADVVKIEPPGAGDPGRGFGARLPNQEGLDSFYFLSLNSNKRSVTLNLASAEGRALFLRLLPRFDVVVENFALGTMEKLGLGYETLRQAHPSVIYATMKGFGTSGPYAPYRSFDMIAQAMGGSMSVTGTAETGPLRAGVSYGDSGSGMTLAVGILAAYVQRLQTGRGQQVEVSMQEAIANYARVAFSAAAVMEQPVGRVGNDLRGLAPTNTYPCRPFGPNDYVYIVTVTGRMFENLAIAIGHPELIDDPRYATAAARREHAEWLQALIREWTSRRTKHEAMAELQGFGVPCGAVLDSRDIFSDPHLLERGMVREVEHPQRGRMRALANPIRLAASPTALEPAPLLGQHTEEVLRAELGLADAELSRLRGDGVI
jgi:formyl-CoA transferase